MSIAKPNYDKLPSRQKALKAAEPQPEAELLDLAQWNGRKSPPKKKATCHPRRAAVTRDGLCKWCYEIRINAVERHELTPDQAIEKQSKPGEIEYIGKATAAWMRENLPTYARVHLEGAKIAAMRGDTKPCEWALQHVPTGDTSVVKAPNKESGSGGVRVLIGLNIGGLPPNAVTAEAIEIPAEGVTTPPSGETK